MSNPSALERNVRRICSKLRSIAQLRFGDKWNSTTQQAEAVTPVTRFWRWGWYWNQSKDNSVNDFKIIFEEAYTVIFELLNLYPVSNEEYQNDLAIWVRDLTEQVADTKMAMIRQKGTYIGHEKTKDELNEIINYITSMSEQAAVLVKEAGVLLQSPKTIESISPQRLNPVHIPMVTKKKVETPAPEQEPEKKDNIDAEINIDLDGFHSAEASDEDF
jgi:hypothetical protein